MDQRIRQEISEEIEQLDEDHILIARRVSTKKGFLGRFPYPIYRRDNTRTNVFLYNIREEKKGINPKPVLYRNKSITLTGALHEAQEKIKIRGGPKELWKLSK